MYKRKEQKVICRGINNMNGPSDEPDRGGFIAITCLSKISLSIRPPLISAYAPENVAGFNFYAGTITSLKQMPELHSFLRQAGIF